MRITKQDEDRMEISSTVGERLWFINPIVFVAVVAVIIAISIKHPAAVAIGCTCSLYAIATGIVGGKKIIIDRGMETLHNRGMETIKIQNRFPLLFFAWGRVVSLTDVNDVYVEYHEAKRYDSRSTDKWELLLHIRGKTYANERVHVETTDSRKKIFDVAERIGEFIGKPVILPPS